jgi:uncharacterized membrane protein YraQ (UPF0718 family)
MTLMKSEKTEEKPKRSLFYGGFLFLFVVLSAYGILFLAAPEKALVALRESEKIIRNILWPLIVVLAVMVCLNLFIHPGRVVRLVGEKSGFRGDLLAAAAGIISMGPIYAWFPFLREVRSKGAGSEPIAVFLGSRAIKPALLPVMISYFGWFYTSLLTLFMLLGAFSLGYVMGFIEKGQTWNVRRDSSNN